MSFSNSYRPPPGRNSKRVWNSPSPTERVYPEKGRFDFVNRQVNVATGTIQITALFPNDAEMLRPGLFARVTAPVQELKDALVVPQAATVELQGNYLVIVLGPDNVVKPVPVKLGPTKGHMQVVMGPSRSEKRWWLAVWRRCGPE